MQLQPSVAQIGWVAGLLVIAGCTGQVGLNARAPEQRQTSSDGTIGSASGSGNIGGVSAKYGVIALASPSQPIDCGADAIQVDATGTGPLKDISKGVWGASWLANAPGDYAAFRASVPDETMRQLGVRLLRFPGGCAGDVYNWDLKGDKTGSEAQMAYVWYLSGELRFEKSITIGQFLDFAESHGADTLYQFNMQAMDAQGNPYDGCYGKTVWPYNVMPKTGNIAVDNAALEAKMLDDALTIVRKYSPPGAPRIREYQLGNEPWAHWPPAVYHQMAVRWAGRIRELQRLGQVDASVRLMVVGMHWGAMPLATGVGAQYDHPEALAWDQYTRWSMAQVCGHRPCFDHVSTHGYYTAGYKPFAPTQGSNFPGAAGYLPTQGSVKQLTRYLTYSPQRYGLGASYESAPEALQKTAVTEWNLFCWQGFNPNNPAHWEQSDYSIGTAEHAFFSATTLLEIALQGTSIAVVHHISSHGRGAEEGGHGCATSYYGEGPTAVGQGLVLTSPWAGGKGYVFTTDSEVFVSPKSACWGQQANCLPGELPYPHVSVYGGPTSAAGKLAIFALNRRSDRVVSVRVKAPENWPLYEFGRIHRFTAKDYTTRVPMTESVDYSMYRAPDVLQFCMPPRSMARVDLSTTQ